MSLILPKGLSEEKVQFIKDFYKVSDEPTSVDKYLSFLSEDVKFIMGPAIINGAPGVREMRKKMWEGVVSRHHKPAQVYVFGEGEGDLMIHGTLDFGLRNGGFVPEVGWAARMLFDDEGKKMKLYQVWLDTSILAKALQAAPSS
ncbi:hypothetical protein MNV49_002591 [Pseudohyphozyma bogoriensis]|nr:hypothetical protein MNV49_002591 [Pseudohyphozyma bogoriensis]